MADGSDGPDVSPEEVAAAGGEIWGTLEELVLACAVSRHGTASWGSVAVEVQTRSSLAARPRLTPHSCRLRFHQLHRRFSVGGGGEEDAEVEVEAEAEAEDPDASAADGWVDELRRLRVAELRREVERYDLSIGTLQTKVKQLREERERSLSGDAKPEGFTGDDRLSGEEPSQSCRESNSTDLKHPKHPGDHGAVKEEEAVKQEASGESVAASKESSDVRSSASLCRRRKSGADEEAEGEEASAPRPPAQSQPLAALLDTIAAKFHSLFERLHESQESGTYRGTIRRHVDLEIVRRKLDGSGACCYPASEFYRDLLLLCTNAVVYFPRPGPEHAAALDARALISAHVSASLREPKREHGAASAPPAAADSRKVEAGADIVGSLVEKGGKPLIVCRKRSSIAKAAAATRKEESAEKSEAEEEESDGEKKAMVATKDKAWGLRTKKIRGPGKNSTGASAALNRKPAKAADGAAAAAEGAKNADKKGADAGAGAAADGLAKKRNAKDFLKRLNQGSSPSKKRASPLGTRKRAAAAVAAATEQQKTRKGPGRKEAGRGGSKKGAKTAATKRGVGRPLKRGAAPTTPPPSKRAKVNRSENASSTKRGGRK